jgi:tetratricopeptide (TPR) repeat protein
MGENLFVSYLKGYIYRLFRKPHRALAVYREILNKWPDKVWLYPRIVKLHNQTKKDILELDLPTLRRALFLRPKQKDIVLTAANYYLRKNITGLEAVKIYNTALEFDPNNIDLLNTLGRFYLQDIQNYAKGLDIYNRLLHLGKGNLLDDEHLVRAFLKRNSEKLYGFSSVS